MKACLFSVEQCMISPWLQPEVLDCKGGCNWGLGFEFLQVCDLDQGPKFVIGNFWLGTIFEAFLRMSHNRFCLLLVVILGAIFCVSCEWNYGAKLDCVAGRLPCMASGIDVFFWFGVSFSCLRIQLLCFCISQSRREHHHEQWCCRNKNQYIFAHCDECPGVLGLFGSLPQIAIAPLYTFGGA